MPKVTDDEQNETDAVSSLWRWNWCSKCTL